MSGTTPITMPRTTADTRATLLRLWNEGYTLPEIALHLGISDHALIRTIDSVLAEAAESVDAD